MKVAAIKKASIKMATGLLASLQKLSKHDSLLPLPWKLLSSLLSSSHDVLILYQTYLAAEIGSSSQFSCIRNAVQPSRETFC